MALQEYNQKRNFSSTAEPEGKMRKSATEMIFVVQKHAASRLHYDFRLESEGVLKSWVIPKGPSMNPAHKRLALQVEDHPYNYRDFEGTIPTGNYGAGTVIVWDKGTYILIDDEKSGNLNPYLQKGQVRFIIKGKKLKGEFILVKLKAKKDNSWLLIKAKDEYVTEEEVLLQDKSVISNATVESLNKVI